MRMVVCLALFSAPVLASCDGCDGGSWKNHKAAPSPEVAVMLGCRQPNVISCNPSMGLADAANGSVVSHENHQDICDDQDVSDMPSGRIPPLCIQGKTNSRFQWMPGILDIVIHYANKWNVTGWLKHVLSMVRAVLKPMRF